MRSYRSGLEFGGGGVERGDAGLCQDLVRVLAETWRHPDRQPAAIDAARMPSGRDTEVSIVLEIAVERLEAEHDAPGLAALDGDDEIPQRRPEGQDRRAGAGGVGKLDFRDGRAV